MFRKFLFSRNLELIDFNNRLNTNNGESTLVAYLTSIGKKAVKFLSVTRFYGVEKDERNLTKSVKLADNSTSYSIT